MTIVSKPYAYALLLAFAPVLGAASSPAHSEELSLADSGQAFVIQVSDGLVDEGSASEEYSDHWQDRANNTETADEAPPPEEKPKSKSKKQSKQEKYKKLLEGLQRYL